MKNIPKYTSLTTFSVSVGTTAVQLTASFTSSDNQVYVKAAAANTANIYIGPSTVTANTIAATDGIELLPGEGMWIPLSNASILYARSGSASQKVFVGIAR